jgi:hypothetical protein
MFLAQIKERFGIKLSKRVGSERENTCIEKEKICHLILLCTVILGICRKRMEKLTSFRFEYMFFV